VLSFEKSPPELVARVDGWLERALAFGKTLPTK